MRPIAIADRPLYAMLLPIPVICFIGGLITDLTFRGSDGNMLWLDFSSWLIAAGLLFGAVAALILLIDVIRGLGGRGAIIWTQFGLLAAALIIELINSFIHARDGWTAVVPTGLMLSIISVLLILGSGWLWQSIRYGRSGERA
ncbi:putative membrane protein [Sphingomonas sp. F9_3S_D5_B_2]